VNVFVERLRNVGVVRYHDRHPFHRRMHEGALDRRQLQVWVLNRYYYQSRIPIKDAILLSKCEDRAFRRVWVERILDQDGGGDDQGGLARWLELARGVGLDPDEVASLRGVLPGVRAACDAYVEFVRDRPLLDGVAASLTELFAPALQARRVAAWERHYPWIEPSALGYFRRRVFRAPREAEHALAFVVREAVTPALQDRCVAALAGKCEILWALLDAVDEATA
jgi:pyrroloquinoline-quinone synthase